MVAQFEWAWLRARVPKRGEMPMFKLAIACIEQEIGATRWKWSRISDILPMLPQSLQFALAALPLVVAIDPLCAT